MVPALAGSAARRSQLCGRSFAVAALRFWVPSLTFPHAAFHPTSSQYELGHQEIIKELNEAEAKADGLWVMGNYRTGVAFPDCVTFGYEHAKVVCEYLGAKEEVKAESPKPQPVKEEATA